MIWLTWRQFRASAAMMGAAIVLLLAVLAVTGPGFADDYADGIASCGSTDECSAFLQRFFDGHRSAFLAVVGIVLVLPALIGLFWGSPLIARELEAGTHRLVWNQSITRMRWLSVKLGLVGLAALAVAAVGSLAIDVWADPIDEAAAVDYPRMEPLLFSARGIAPIGYAAFAFALGVTAGMLVRRTVPAMAITLAAFLAVQIAMPLLVRPHLMPAKHATIELSSANVDGIFKARDEKTARAFTQAPEGGAFTGAWVLSSHAIDPDGRAVDSIPLAQSGACFANDRSGSPEAQRERCFAEINRVGYRQQVTYQPSSRYWSFQAIETALFTGVALLLLGFCFWWLRHRLA
jgi:hypothetical protein